MTVSSTPSFTILTPTWNRAHLLPRLYRSIVDAVPEGAAIEWLVVDDGSTDDTKRLVEAWQNEAKVPITLLRIVHGGKHRALNAGLPAARGTWTVIVDSDDRLLKGAWEGLCETLGRADRLGATFAFLPINVLGRTEQYRFLRPGASISLAERLNSEPQFDATIALHRDISWMRSPEISDEMFMAEGAFIYGLPADARAFLGDIPCVAAEYQPDGLSHTMSEQRIASPLGAMLNAQVMLRIAVRPAIVLRSLANYARFWWHAVLQARAPLAPETIAQALAIPVGLPFAIADRFRLHRVKRGRSVDR